jgi:hypothetical protein
MGPKKAMTPKLGIVVTDTTASKTADNLGATTCSRTDAPRRTKMMT